MAGRYGGDTQTFTPKMIPGLVLWLDGQDPTANGIVPGTFAQIPNWIDKSNMGNNASQATSAKQPTYALGLFPTSLNALTFAPASSQFMTVGTNGFPSTSGGRTTFCVFQSTNTTLTQYIFSQGTAAGAQTYNQALISTEFCTDFFASAIFATTTTPVNNTPYLLETNYPTGASETSLTQFVNGVSQTHTTDATVPNTQFGTGAIGSQVGGGSGFYDGFIMEILHYNSSLSVAKQTLVRAYLLNKYGI